jgi:hypothetical protein
MSTVRKEALASSSARRLQLIEELWDSLAATPESVPRQPGDMGNMAADDKRASPATAAAAPRRPTL